MSPGPSTQSCVGRELAQQLELDVVAEFQRRIGAGVDLPAPMALRLQQEHVVLVDVRADRTAGRGEATP